MKRYFAWAFLLTGLLLTTVSCAPLARMATSGFSADAATTSFLGAAMVLTFACLFTLTGVLIEAKRAAVPASGGGASRSLRWLLTISPLAIYAALPMAHLLGPLIVYRSADEASLRRDAARSLNFQVTWTLFAVVALLLCVVLVGVFMLAALVIFHIAVSVMAAVSNWRGRDAAYPLSVEFVPVAAPPGATGPRSPA